MNRRQLFITAGSAALVTAVNPKLAFSEPLAPLPTLAQVKEAIDNLIDGGFKDCKVYVHPDDVTEFLNYLYPASLVPSLGVWLYGATVQFLT